jgi:hypothetical protein
MILVKKSAFEKSLIKEISEIQSKTASIKNGLLIQKYNHLTKSSIQALLYDKTNNKVSKSVIKPIILEACLRSEMIAPGSGGLCLDFVLKILPDIIRKQKSQDFILEETFNEFIKNLSKNIKSLGNRSTGSSITEHIKNLNIPAVCKLILEETYNLSGKSGVIKVKKSNKQETKIIVQNGSNFSLKPDNVFLGKSGKWINNSVNCVAVDGIVLEVSEIHHLLELATETKEPFVIFAREFSPEVSQTISHNFSRGTLNVVPVCVPLDESSLNRLVDVAVICGIDVISSQKGETISASITRGLSKVEKIVFDSKGITIHNSSTNTQKNRHIERIIETKNNEDFNSFSQEVINEKHALIDKRLSELFSETILIEVGQNLLHAHRGIIEKLDQSLREIKSHTNIGYVSKSMLMKELNDDDFLESSIKDMLLKQEKEIYSVESIILAAKFSKSIIKSICSVESVLFYN